MKEKFVQNVYSQIQEYIEDNKSRALVIKELRKYNKDKLIKLIEDMYNEFQNRPKLEQIILVSYMKHPRSLGSGCTAIVVNREGYVNKEYKRGEYGCIWVV